MPRMNRGVCNSLGDPENLDMPRTVGVSRGQVWAESLGLQTGRVVAGLLCSAWKSASQRGPHQDPALLDSGDGVPGFSTGLTQAR